MTKQELQTILDQAKAEKRSLTEDEKRQLDEGIAELEERAKEEKEEPSEEPEQEEEKEPEQEEKSEDVETKSEDEEPKEEEKEQEEEPEEKEQENKEIKQEKKNMNTNFSIVRSIRSIANNQPLNEVDAAIINEGKKQNRGLDCNGQIQIPFETRSAVTVSVEGEDLVPTEVWDIMKPLRAENVLVKAGAKVYGGLVGDVKIPVMGKANVSWEEETATAKNGEPTFTHVALSPKRISAVVEISKMLLAQDSVDVENAIREDLIKAVNAKIEETLLGTSAGTTTQPEGLFYTLEVTGATSANTVSTFAQLCEKEAEVEDENVTGRLAYVMSNKAKAILRAMAKSTKNTQLVMEGGYVDGTEAYNTSLISDKKYIFGDFSNVVIGQWSGLDITVDPFTLAADGKIRLVVNMYVDAKLARPEALTAAFVANA